MPPRPFGIQSSMLLAGVLIAAAAVSTPADLGPVPVEQVRVFLIRHGQAYSNLDPTPDLPPAQLDRLTDLGHSQSRRAGLALKGHGVALVLSSPAGRARESADELSAALGAGVARMDARLRPLELGRTPAGHPLDWDAREAEWAAGRDPQPDGGESLDQVGRRVQELVTNLAKDHRGASIVLVAHSEVIGAFLGLVAGTPAPRRLDASSVRNGSITVVEAGAAGPEHLVLLDYVPSETSAPRR